ncbi:MAG: NADH-quinone oxidoreductase subunit L, partial [Thermodesulfobacteriota bacterium]|nr:NADH-quinone oxidoreductase subunit L [Thermodesulfobacteriota bacterium]
REIIAFEPAERVFEITLYSWIPVGDLEVPLGFLVDPLSVVMMLTVSFVGFLIHVYSIGYMHDDEGFTRYFAYLNLFVFFMLLLVSANSFLLMFVGWEGVGLCSYLLIGFWYRRKSPADAGKKAFIVNRIGDYGFILAMLLIFVNFNTLNFIPVFEHAGTFHTGSIIIIAITLLLFLGACGKSAQIPLYVWLPDAMEGPTPVSALIHAATMVTAGVYMVARCAVLFSLAPISLLVVAIIGGLTAIFSASIAVTQNDIKRVLAYSTVSQLGYMFLACGCGAYAAGIFHLMTHAFFKALLFMGAGSVMHALGGELNIQKMGALRKYMPRTHWTFIMGTLALCGIAPFAGFFSKDEILFNALVNRGIIFWGVGAAAAFLTSFYMFRLVFLTFYGKSRMDEEVEHHAHESPNVMTVPLMILAFFSLVIGWVGMPLIKGDNIFNSFHRFLDPVFSGAKVTEHVDLVALAHASEEVAHNAAHHHSAGLEIAMMLVSVLIAVAGILTAYFIYLKSPGMDKKLGENCKEAYTWSYNKFFVDEFYFAFIVYPIRDISLFLWKIVDSLIVDGVVNGAGFLVRGISGILRKIQTGFIQNYALSILFGVVLIILYCLF